MEEFLDISIFLSNSCENVFIDQWENFYDIYIDNAVKYKINSYSKEQVVNIDL